MEGQPLTFGQKAVGLRFNHAEGATHDAVDTAKRSFANIIDQMNDLRNATSSQEQRRHASVAITMAEDAQMRAVKALTWQDS